MVAAGAVVRRFTHATRFGDATLYVEWDGEQAWTVTRRSERRKVSFTIADLEERAQRQIWTEIKETPWSVHGIPW